MKSQIYIFCLKALRGFARVRQIGNPFHKAPFLKEDPIIEEGVVNCKIREVDGEVRIWRLSKIIATALYGGALINGKNEAYTRFLSFPLGKPLHPVFSFPYIGKKHVVLNKAIYLITPEANGNYYHWMIDLLPRLLLIKKYSLPDFLDSALILHSPQRSYETDTLDLLNISAKNVVRIKPFEMVEAKDLVVSDYYSNETNFPNWKKILLNEFKELAIAPFIPEKDYNKVYLYRGKQNVRRLIDEERLVGLLRERGFQVVDPQKLSLAEQIVILKQARIVVAIHGAALTNIIYCREGSCVIELRSTNKSPEHYSSIAKAYNLNFETILLPPARLKEKRHLANKENLILTERSIEILLSKISASEKSFDNQ